VASIVGKDRALEFVTLSNADLNSKVAVSVKEGSLIPKDEMAEANMSLELAGMNRIDDITLLDKLDFPDPKATAERNYMQLNAPQLLFPKAGRAALDANEAIKMEQAATDMTVNEEAQMGQQAIAPPEKEEPKKETKKK